MPPSSPVQRRSIGSSEIQFIDLTQESQANVILSKTRRYPGLQLQAETSETSHMRMPLFNAQVYLGSSTSTQSSSTTTSEATRQGRQIARKTTRRAHPETNSELSLPGTLESVQPQASISASIVRSANSIAVSTAASVSGAQSSDLSSSIMAKKFKCAKCHREYIHKARLLRHYKASPSCNVLNPASQIQTRDPGYFDTKQCRWCGAADFFFGTVEETRRHYREQHPITCIECALRCSDERDREVHEREHHGISYSLEDGEDEEQELPAVESRLAATEAPVRPLSQSPSLNLPSAMDALIESTSVTGENLSDQHSLVVSFRLYETIPIKPRISVKKAYFSENKLPTFFKPPTKLETNSSSLIAENCCVSESTDGLIKGYGLISTMETIQQKSTLFRASAEEKQVLNLPTAVALDELYYEQVEEITAVENKPKFVNVAKARTLRPMTERVRLKLIKFESPTVEDTVETPELEIAEEMPNPYPHSANCIVEVVERSELARASLSAPVEVKRNAKKTKLNVAALKLIKLKKSESGRVSNNSSSVSEVSTAPQKEVSVVDVVLKQDKVERTVESQKAVASKSEKASDASSVELVKMRARKTVRSSKRRKEGESYCSAVSDASAASDDSDEIAAKRKKVKTSSDTTAASEALSEKLSTEKTLPGSEINPVSTGAQNQNIKVDKPYNGAAKLHNLSNSEKQISSSALLPKPSVVLSSSASSTKATKSPEQLKTVPDSTAVCLPVQRPAFFVAVTASSSEKLSAAILSKPSLAIPKKSSVAVLGKPSHAMPEKSATAFPEKTIAEIPQKPSTVISKKSNAPIPEKVTATIWSEKMKTLVSSPKVIPLVSKEVARCSKTPLAISTADMDAGKDVPLMATDVQESMSCVPLSNSFSFEPRKRVQHTRKELADSQSLGPSNSFSNKSPEVVPYFFLSNAATKRPAHVALNDSAMSRSPPKVAKPALPTSNKGTDRESRTKAYERSPEKTTSTVILPSMKQTECYSLPQRIDGRNRKQSEAINNPRSSNISGYGSHRKHTEKRSNESNSRCAFMSSEKLSKEVKSSGVPTSSENRSKHSKSTGAQTNSENRNRDSKSGTTVSPSSYEEAGGQLSQPYKEAGTKFRRLWKVSVPTARTPGSRRYYEKLASTDPTAICKHLPYSKPCKRKELFRSGSPEEPAEEVSKLATSVAANISDPLLEQVSYILNQMPISETISSNQQASLEPKQIPLEPILKSIRTKPNSSFPCTSELPTKQQSKTTVIPLVRTQLAEASDCSSNAVSAEVCEAPSSSACSSSVSRVPSVPLTNQKALSSPAVPPTTHRFSSLSTDTDEDEPPPLKPVKPFETHNCHNANISARSGTVSTGLSPGVLINISSDEDDLGDDIFTDDVGCANQTPQSRKVERKDDINFSIYVENSNRSTAISDNAIQDLSTANTASFPTANSNSPSSKQYNWKSSSTSSDASSKVSPSSNKVLKESGKHIASKKFCELCKRSFCELEKHFDKFHSPKPSIEPVPGCQKCADCGLYFGKSVYSKHRIRYHERLGSKHICYRCGLEFQCNGYLIDHLKFEHREQSKQIVDLSSTEDKYRYRLARSGAESIE
ncbi:uncharacterized protein LOC134845205 isoform X3 [Symsagittifera roscoffensis]|uniref:uncharacterized protein LOC134845205 isoform X3 n=1 Tax=Symsagittifera roscoffensis TaxID=84072 RepID=UPI00307C1144